MYVRCLWRPKNCQCGRPLRQSFPWSKWKWQTRTLSDGWAVATGWFDLSSLPIRSSAIQQAGESCPWMVFSGLCPVPLDPPNTQTPSSRLFPRALSLCASPFSWLFLHFQLSFGYGVWEQIEVDKQKSRKSYRQSTYENNNTKLWSRVVLEILDETRSTVLCVWKNIIIFQVFACTFYITVECNYNAIIFIVLLEEIALQYLFYYFIFYTL